MKSLAYENLFKQEEKYWWFIGQRILTNVLLNKHYDFDGNIKILDVGCGTGINLKMYSKYGFVEGIDISDDAINFCKQRGLKIKKGNAMSLPYKNESFDIVSALGVFYHKDVTDDVKAISELFRTLKPGGRAYLLDPAMNCLWGKHDQFFNAGRRYQKKELLRKLKSVGFKVEFISYINVFIFPLVYIHRKLEKFSNSKPKSDVEKISPMFNKILLGLYKFELKMLKYFNPPLGVNIYSVVQKPLNLQ